MLFLMKNIDFGYLNTINFLGLKRDASTRTNIILMIVSFVSVHIKTVWLYTWRVVLAMAMFTLFYHLMSRLVKKYFAKWLEPKTPIGNNFTFYTPIPSDYPPPRFFWLIFGINAKMSEQSCFIRCTSFCIGFVHTFPSSCV